MSLLHVLVAVTLVVAIAPVLARALGRAAGWVLAAALLGCAGMVVSLHTPGERLEQVVPWIPSADIMLSLRLDGVDQRRVEGVVQLHQSGRRRRHDGHRGGSASGWGQLADPLT